MNGVIGSLVIALSSVEEEEGLTPEQKVFKPKMVEMTAKEMMFLLAKFATLNHVQVIKFFQFMLLIIVILNILNVYW